MRVKCVIMNYQLETEYRMKKGGKNNYDIYKRNNRIAILSLSLSVIIFKILKNFNSWSKSYKWADGLK